MIIGLRKLFKKPSLQNLLEPAKEKKKKKSETMVSLRQM